MQEKISEQPAADTPVNTGVSNPDESGGLHFEGHLKIFDPDTNEVFVSVRA